MTVSKRPPPQTFALVPVGAALDRDLEPVGPMAVLVAIARYRNAQSGEAVVGVPRLARDLGTSDRSVQRALRKLRERGWVQEHQRYGEGGRQLATAFIIQFRPVTETVTPDDDRHRPVTRSDTPSVTLGDASGDTNRHPKYRLSNRLPSTDISVQSSAALVDEAHALWMLEADQQGWPNCGHLTAGERHLLAKRLHECGGLEGWKLALEKGRQADGFRDADGSLRPWVSIDLFLRPGTFKRLMEDRYRVRFGQLQTSSLSAAIAGMPGIGAGTYPVAFGDFKQGYTIVDKLGVRWHTDPYTVKGQVQFYAYRRTGGGLTNSDAIKLLKIST